MNWVAGFLGQITANDRMRIEVPNFADMEQHPYGWLSLLPPVVAILLAILTRRVIISLLVAIFVGAMVLGFYSEPRAVNYEPTGWDLVQAGAVSTWYDHLWPTLLNADKVSVFVFTCLMGAIVGMVNRAAGMRGLISLMSPITNSRVGVQISTWLSGMFIFFDDYANTMLLGTTYRPVYDRLRVSREKLAYIVDSTAAPVAGLAIVSTWIAGELAYINDGLAGVDLGQAAGKTTAFGLFVASIPYRFYVIWALFFVLVSAVMRRDFGPMLKAERKAFSQDPHSAVEEFSLPKDLDWKRLPISNEVVPVEMAEVVAVAHDPTLAPMKTPARSMNAVLPIFVTVATILGLMYQTGVNNQPDKPTVYLATDVVEEAVVADTSFSAQIMAWGDIFGASDSYASLVWGSVVGVLFTWFWLTWQRIMPSAALVQAAGRGAANMIPALAILWLASTLSTMTSSDPSDPHQRDLENAQSIAKAIAGLPEMGEQFSTLERTEKIALALRLHQVPESVVVETMVGQYRDPNQFWQEILQHVGDDALSSGFYGRYLNKDNQQVDWRQFQKDLKDRDPDSAKRPTGEGPSLVEETLRQQTKGPGRDQPPAPEEKPSDEPPLEEEKKLPQAKEDERSDQVALWPTSVRRRTQDPQSNSEEMKVESPANPPAEQGSEATAQDEPDQPSGGPGRGGPGGGGPGGGGPGGGGGGPPGGGGGMQGGGMVGMFAGRRAEPDLSKVFETVDGGLSFPFTDVKHRLHTGRYLSSVLLRWVGPADSSGAVEGPHPFAKWLPTLVFLLAAFTAFSTGTSWGTMGIIMPLAIPLVGSMLSLNGPVDPNNPIFVATIAGVLAGAIFGDHCSPISDTTVLSSSASGCDHLAHVWTQMPYALTVCGVSVLFGTLPIGFGLLPWWICLPLGTVALVAIMYVVGQPVEVNASETTESPVKANP